MRLDNAAQLRAIEEASPHIANDDEECWLRLINKKYAVLHAQHDLIPRNPASWHKVFAKYARINEKAKTEAEAKLKAAFAGINKKKAENASSIESYQKLPRPPRDMKNVGRKAAVGRRGGSNDTGELKFTAGSRTKMTSGASVMRRVKREAAEVAARNKLATPNGALRVRQGQIKQAPKGMAHEHSVKFNPSVKLQPAPVRSEEDEIRDRHMREREARLNKLKANGANILEDSDVDDDDADNVFGGGQGGGQLNVNDLEDMFDDDDDDRPSKPNTQQKSASLPGKKAGLLSNSYRGSSTTRPVSNAVSTSASRPIAQDPPTNPRTQSLATSPARPVQVANGPSGSPELKPRMPVKRKAVDVFMKQKPKVQRR